MNSTQIGFGLGNGLCLRFMVLSCGKNVAGVVFLIILRPFNPSSLSVTHIDCLHLLLLMSHVIS